VPHGTRNTHREANGMIYFVALIPATALTVAGYCVLYVSHRSEGSFRSFGKYLGFWAFSLAGLVILGAIFAAAHGDHYAAMMRERSALEMMHHHWPVDPRFFGPGFGEPHDSWQPAGAPRDGAERAPVGAPLPSAAPNPAPVPAR
jgi:hypothetical protein